MTGKNRGFTLIELVVVMAVMGVVLFFTLPRFDAFKPFGPSITPTGKLLLLVERLKSQVRGARQGVLLHLDPATGRVWVTALTSIPGEADLSEKESVSESNILFSDNSTIENVTISGGTVRRETGGDDTVVEFDRDGYSDLAFIHIREDDRELTVVISPFLPRAQLLEGDVSCEP